ncbi:hypothetical protein [Argonema antarcticum]|nr:hypothetical protein [Argonema antarcticum]MCL1472776.1 hypothetical protein [Argonema antarcticum A004/B2]
MYIFDGALHSVNAPYKIGDRTQFLTFAIANNLSQLNNEANHFCLPNLE